MGQMPFIIIMLAEALVIVFLIILNVRLNKKNKKRFLTPEKKQERIILYYNISYKIMVRNTPLKFFPISISFFYMNFNFSKNDKFGYSIV